MVWDSGLDSGKYTSGNIYENYNVEITTNPGLKMAFQNAMAEVFETIAKVAGVKPLPFRVPAAPIQLLGSITERICKPFGIEPPIFRRRVDFFVKNRCFKTDKAQEQLGFKPRYDFGEEADLLYRWYKNHGWL